jgi:hypothetical protein
MVGKMTTYRMHDASFSIILWKTKERWMKHITSIIRYRVLSLLITTILLIGAASAAVALPRGESTEYDPEIFQRLRISSPSVHIEVVPSNASARIETRLDRCRELTISKNGDELIVELTSVRGITARNEFVKLYIENGKSITIGSGSGSVKISDIGYENLVINAGSGSTNLHNCYGPIMTTAGSGKTVISDVKGKTDGREQRKISLSKSDGDIIVSYGSGAIRLNDISGALMLSGGSGAIIGTSIQLTGNSAFNAGSGRIDLTFRNSENELAFDLTTNSGSIRVGRTRSANRVVVGSGGIQETSEGGSGRQIYKYQ